MVEEILTSLKKTYFGLKMTKNDLF